MVKSVTYDHFLSYARRYVCIYMHSGYSIVVPWSRSPLYNIMRRQTSTNAGKTLTFIIYSSYVVKAALVAICCGWSIYDSIIQVGNIYMLAVR